MKISRTTREGLVWVALAAWGMLLLGLMGWGCGWLMRGPEPASDAGTTGQAAGGTGDAEPAQDAAGTKPKETAPAGAVLVAYAGFNAKSGLGTDGRATVYQLGTTLDRTGNADEGWAGPWGSMGTPSQVRVETEAAMEGDGGMRFWGTKNFVRRELAVPVQGKFQITAQVKAPDTSSPQLIIRPDEGGSNFGPQWAAFNGQFQIIDGGGSWTPTGILFAANTWYQVTIIGDCDAQTWTLQVNDQSYPPGGTLRFRGTPHSIGALGWFTSSTVYLDAIKVYRMGG